MPASSATQASNPNQRRDRWILALLVLALVLMAASGLAYSKRDLLQQHLFGDKPSAQPQVQLTKLQQQCQDKLVQYLAQGGIDIEAQINFGDMQGCDFSTERERAEQQQRRAGSTASLKIQ
ncbi:hypothetical protein DV711_12290 [Motiliproteus coralliicola]|uniref:Uncharacterized protein n=1 Tax=Motiliproteus coralliicola TaxID=2283196 RepID=A0A369WJN1_9GAMM|nr:hypothetical protein [Motiliproteus coralliicola]RDE19655.1 hypothetical protein DV711_12290 [Motiliproteus coralliicola]